MSKKEYDFTDLILLIGTNPLPNYVVAKYFHITNKSLKRVWLIYSEKTNFYEGTVQYAENLKQVMKNEFRNKEVIYMLKNLSDISQANIIEKQVVDNLLKSNLSGIEKVHLNYTGGTKAMSVHAYRAFEREFGGNFSASYLDARDYNIKFDKNPDINTGDLRKLIQLEVSDLFSLHNSEIIPEDNNREGDYLKSIEDSSRSENILRFIAKLADQNKLLDLRNWFTAANMDKSDNNDSEQAGSLFDKPKSTDVKDTKKIIDNRLSNFTHKDNPELFSLLSLFPDNDKFCDKDGKWLYDNFGITGKANNSKYLKEFLNGKWLEAYVAWVLKQQTGEEKNIITNVNLGTKNKDTNSGSKKFEIDVLVKNGYQICGISCGTAVKYEKGKEKLSNTLKSKGFEVILRSSQIGGEEARSVLVTLLNPKLAKNLENDLKAATGAGQDKFIVLGRDDLPAKNMLKKLQEHIYE